MGSCGRILCTIHDVNLAAVLKSGQSFRWVRLPSEEWVGPLGRHVWILRQDESGITFRTLPPPKSEASLDEGKARCFLEDYFQLGVNLRELYSCWSAADEAFSMAGRRLPGVRMLRQDPVENLFCFICSSNNNIQRITSMVEKLCERYGEPLGEHAGRTFHAFPAVSRLAEPAVEAELRALGFGYRARYVRETAHQVAERGGAGWLRALRSVPYATCHGQLRQLCGVGAKVADCVCLMSLDQPAAVPVDTHVHQLALRHYLPQLRHTKTLTDRTYRQVADHFRLVFGERAGWAQAVLFCGDLAEFKKAAADEASGPAQESASVRQTVKCPVAPAKTTPSKRVRVTAAVVGKAPDVGGDGPIGRTAAARSERGTRQQKRRTPVPR
ncbi:N-glycosylase/DNA lyase-like [Pollicipes pollicipes]|uniref:N-glycosylase/DNA lyase-like n=1 Tax=Pollicipes pollicipes TaxID=41117 RepID=UPI00188514B7|nr:N-glycosylase/DNA lyase-like [Pollicipes pollicipes]